MDVSVFAGSCGAPPRDADGNEKDLGDVHADDVVG